MPAVRPLESFGDALGMGDDLTEVTPYQLVELCGRSVTSRTMLYFTSPSRQLPIPTDVIVVLLVQAPATTGHPAYPAAHQGAQQVGVLLIVALGQLAVALQFLLNPLEALRINEGGDFGHRDPLLRRPDLRGASRVPYRPHR